MNNPYATPDPPSDGYGSLEELRAATPQEQPTQAFPGDKHGVPPGPNPYATPDVAENPYAAGNPYATPDEVETKPGAWDRIKAQTAGVMGEIQGVDTYLRQGPKPDWTDLNAVPSGLLQGGDRVISTAVHAPAGVLEHYFGSDDKRDAHFKEIESRAKLTKMFTDEKFPTTGSKLSEITEGVAQLPYFIADKVVASLSVAGNGISTTNSLLEQGVPFQLAVTVAAVQGGGDAALAMLPYMKGNPSVARILAQGPVTGAGLNYIAYEMLMTAGHEKAAQAFDPRDPANIIPDLVGAGVAGKAARDNQKALAGDNVIKDKAQAILTARKEIRDLEAKMAEEAAAKGEVPPPEATPVPPKKPTIVGKEYAGEDDWVASNGSLSEGTQKQLLVDPDGGYFWGERKDATKRDGGREAAGEHAAFELARFKSGTEARAAGDQTTNTAPKGKTAPKQGELDLQNQNAAYELATGHKTEAPEATRIDAARLEDTTQPEVARTAPEPDFDPTGRSAAELQTMREDAAAHNQRVDEDFVAKNYPEELAAFKEKSQRGRDKFLEDRLTVEQDTALQRQYADVERIKDHASKVGQFDDTSPEAMGRSIGLWFKRADAPDFKSSADYAGIVSALKHAKEQGWDLDKVMDGARGRVSQWAGNDAAEIFPRMFKEASEPQRTPDLPKIGVSEEFIRSQKGERGAVSPFGLVPKDAPLPPPKQEQAELFLKDRTAPEHVPDVDADGNRTIYHGSPHAFDQPDSSFMGTGEGSQVFSKGFYAAENSKVAESYTTAEGLKLQADRAKWHFDKMAGKDAGPYPEPKEGGNLYKGKLPESKIASMLDWDKPLSKQTPQVKAALKKAGVDPEGFALSTGKDLLSGADRYPIRDRATAAGFKSIEEYLHSSGILGVRYLDQFSRATGKGTSNFVLYDAKDATLTHRNNEPVKTFPNGITVTKDRATNQTAVNNPESTQTSALTNDGRRVVFKGQAGAAHVDLISGGLASVADKIASTVRKPSDSTSPLAKPDQQIEAMSKIPGQSDLKNHVSKDTPPDTVIAKLKELGKDMKPHWDWIGGPELTGWIKDNPMVYAMSSWWGNGHDRHNLNNKEVIVPLEHQISKLVRTGKMYDVMAVRQAEMYAKERLSAEDLAKIGMSPEQIAVHQEMTRQFDAQLARTNEILRSQNRPEIAAHEAYSASQRRGNWKTPVYDKKGKIVGFVQETSKGRAHYALKRIAKAHPDVDISKSKPEMDMSASDGTSRFAGMDNFTALNKILGSDHPLVQEIRSTQDQMIREMGTNVLGFDKHMLPKTGARYAFGEQPWKTDHQNIIDWAEGQVAYLRDASLWSELQQAATNTKLVLNDPTLKADQPMTLQWARDKMNSELGYGARPAVRKMERILSKGLGDLAYEFSKVFPPLAHVPTDMRSINQGIGVGKAMFYIQKLGFFNGKFMGISLMQPVYAISHHMRLSKEGYRHNPIQTLAEAQWMSSVALMGHWTDRVKINGTNFSQKVDPHLSKTLSNAIKYMEANGIANINQMSEVGDLDQSPTMRVLTEGAQLSISQPETIARTEVFMTFVSHLNQSKARGDWKGTEHEMFQKAEEVMTMVMGNYNHNDRAMVFNKLGAAGGALNALKTYPLNMAGQMVGFAKDGVRGNGYSPLMAQIGIGLALAGSMGVMGREYIEGLWDWLLEGYVAAGFSDPAVINFSPLKVMLEMGEASGAFGLFSEAMNAVGATSEDKDKLAKGLQYGLPSVATGRDLSGSLGNQGPEPTVDGMLPWLADFSKQSHKVGTFLLDKDQRSADRAIHALAPSSVQGNLEMSLPTMTNPDRPNLQLPINNPDMPGIERTQKMIDAKKTLTVPTNTIEESDARKILYKKQQNEKFFNKAKINVAEKFNAAVFQGHGETELKRLLTRYTELDGDPDTLINGIDKKAEARMMTFMERLGEAATGDVAALKYKRYKEAWDRRIQEKK